MPGKQEHYNLLKSLSGAEREVEQESSTDEITKELLSRLDILHVNLLTVEDIPVLLEVLDLPVEKSDDALRILESYDKSVDWKARKERYQSHPIYGPMV